MRGGLAQRRGHSSTLTHHFPGGHRAANVLDQGDGSKDRLHCSLRQRNLLGIPARAVSAVTCEEGCGISVWELEFGKLSLSDIRRLRTWVRAAPKTAWDMDPGSPIAVQLVVRATGEVSLVCDIST